MMTYCDDKVGMRFEPQNVVNVEQFWSLKKGKKSAVFEL